MSDERSREASTATRKIATLFQVAQIVELIAPIALAFFAAAVWLPQSGLSSFLSLESSTAGLIGGVALLSAIGLGLQAMLLRRSPIQGVEQLLVRLLSATLILLVSITAVVFWKYLAWLVPDTWNAQSIFLHATQQGSLIEIYTVHHDRPTIGVPIYPPGYYALLQAALAVFGHSPSVLRWITVVALVATCVALALASRRGSRDLWALLAPALFLAFLSAVTWSGAPTKPEYVACAFAMAGLAVYLQKGFAGSMRWAPLSAVLFGAALLVKYTIAGAFLGVCAHLILRKEYRTCVVFFAISLGMVALVYGVLTLLTDGGVVLFTIRANAAAPDVKKIIEVGVMGIMSKPFIVLSIGAAAILGFRARDLGGRGTVVCLAVLASVALALLAMGKPGSSPNYFLESVALGALALALLVRQSADSGARDASALFPSVVLLVLALIQLPGSLLFAVRNDMRPGEQAEARAYLAELKPGPGTFVMADAYYVFDVVQAGYTPVMLDNLAYTLMVDNGLIDERWLLEIFKSGRVPYLVLETTLQEHEKMGYGARFYPVSVMKYLKEHYTCQTKMQRMDALLVICSQE